MKTVNEERAMDRLLKWGEGRFKTDAEFARFLGVSPETFNNWKKRRDIPVAAIFDIAKKMRWSAERLRTGQEPEFDEDVLVEAGKAARSYLVRHDKELTQGEFLLLVMMIYRELLIGKKLSDADITSILGKRGIPDEPGE
jgi:hypothetical protein